MSYSIKIKDYGFGKNHNEKSREIYNFISEVDFDNGDAFCFRSGGDGDNGELLMDLLDAYFERFNSSGWIPVSERLPEENGEYIVMIERATRPTFLNYYAGEWFGWDEDGIEYYEVVAWQPLPEPYKEG